MADRSRPRYEGDPTLARVMRSPRWIAALLLAIAIAGAFAWLGQWQLGHALVQQHEDEILTEVPRPLTDLTAPGEVVTDGSAGMVTTIEGQFVPGDFLIVENRSNDGEIGVWLTGHLRTADGGNLAVAIGWASDVESAQRSLDTLASSPELTAQMQHFEGRYMPSDGADLPAQGSDPERITSMAAAQLVNIWAPFDGAAYAGYFVMHPAGALDATVYEAWGLDAIDSVAPLPPETINWLNLFYAAEWVVFAGFAVYLWYRLARDDWERIHELRLQEATEAAGVDSGDHAVERDPQPHM